MFRPNIIGIGYHHPFGENRVVISLVISPVVIFTNNCFQCLEKQFHVDIQCNQDLKLWVLKPMTWDFISCELSNVKTWHKISFVYITFHFPDKRLSYRIKKTPRPCLNIKTVFSRYKKRLTIRRSWDQLIFNMGIPILVIRHLYIETPTSKLAIIAT